MASAKFCIGIDLGTTNCVMAFASLESPNAPSELFFVPQWEGFAQYAEASALPSFLYFPSDAESSQMQSSGGSPGEWIPGRFARKRAAEAPSRVVHSAKSWLSHHAADPGAPFLPWRSDEIPVNKRISPIQASAILLRYLRAVWDMKFARQGADARFDAQDITITVPASFDPLAQRLTLEAAREAGFPEGVRLLEEPQAAFYCWLEQHGTTDDLWRMLPATGVCHLAVIDIGGGTSDFSLFEISRGLSSPIPHIKRIAVSDHLLLGGDNIDLAIAHRIESRLTNETLAPRQWNYLVARCRDLKEGCLTDSSGNQFSISIPGAGSSLLGRTLTTQIEREEIESIVLDGFFPQCAAADRPARIEAGLREWALPYAADSAVTRYLADFLRDQPQVDALLFNGGALYPEMLRSRIQQQIAQWRKSANPLILDNREPGVAVARGAARFGSIVHRKARRIEAGAARSIYLEVYKQAVDKGDKTVPSLVCILPRNAASEQKFEITDLDLKLRVNRPVRFQPYYSTRRDRDKAGALVIWNGRDFSRLPPLQTIARLRTDQTGAVEPEGADRLPVALTARMNELGLLQVDCVSADPRLQQSWPLEFNLRSAEQEGEDPTKTETDLSAESGVDAARLDTARLRIASLFSRPPDKRGGLSANDLFKSLEQILGMSKADWNWVLIRSLWPSLHACFSYRKGSVEHEEAWLILTGFLLRPGFGAERDETRINELWQLHKDGLAHPGKRIQIQQYILWRRVAGGLSHERQETILTPELSKLRTQKSPAAELVRLAGSLERISLSTKTELIDLFLNKARELAAAKQYSAPYLVALGLLLNRTPFYSGQEAAVPPVHVERVFDALSDLDWNQPELAEIQTLFLRAARFADNSALDLPKSIREKIASRLENSGVAPAKTRRIRSFVPVANQDRSSLFGESLPPGLLIEGSD
jgi:molecular chaperone DnaK (HSP70)